MRDITYVVTYRDDGTVQRRANLASVLDWVRTLHDVDLVVVEQDEVPKSAVAAHDGMRWVFAYNPGPFNKSWGLNVGAKLTTSALLAFGDADVICAQAWPQAVRLLREQFPVVKPYRRIVDLTEQESACVRAGQWNFQPQRPPDQLPNREAKGEFVVFAGGLFLVRREVFDRVGGFDEGFLGWGGEDDAMTLRLIASAAPMHTLDLTPALHLWHPRSPATTFKQAHYRANCALLSEYRCYDQAQLVRLCESQELTIGNRDKYRNAQ